MLFFFYGTLMNGSDNPVARSLHQLLENLGPATTCGELYALPDPAGWFPALLPGKQKVHGCLYSATGVFDEDALARMDAYEDCIPSRPDLSLYRRETIDVLGHEGATVQAQAYIFNRLLPRAAQPVPLGDFRGWLEASGFVPFAGSHG